MLRSNINIFNEDCLPAMRKMKDNEFSLALVDPPYGINKGLYEKAIPVFMNQDEVRNKLRNNEKTKTYLKKSWDSDAPTKEYFSELLRISKNQIIFGINHFHIDILKSSGRIIWVKGVFVPSFSKAEIAYTNIFNKVELVKYIWAGMHQGKKIGSDEIQQNKKLNENRIHPTQKPVQLYKWLLQNYAKEGDKILDTHGGSMSIAIACWDLCFDLTLYEIDKDYFEEGKARLERHKAQGQLF